MICKPNSCYRAVMSTLLVISTAIALPAFAQEKQADPLLKIYRETPAKINDLVHTQLDVRFDYKKRYLYGKEWVTLKPHFYPTDTLRLDAKGMDIKSLGLVKNGKVTPLKYTYDNLSLAIRLDKVYQAQEKYTLFIEYTAKPDELQLKAGAAITDAKGLYFINPDSTEKGKPVQIWTQGELESSSAWFPTIDHTNQKTTQEISMTVPSKYVTLSNGRLDSQKSNPDGTRTDTWKMELPHSPYLFMMAVGDFKIYKDKWRDKEVSYYLEPAYAPYAKEIFGFTPEVMEFYSGILGVDYPWNKYAQIVVRDYVSGAMENTSATLHGSYVQGNAREMADRYYDKGRSTIVHELFHQWFGDYVTAESWSNLTVNESFADFSETLWAEHKYGQDSGDAHNHEALTDYLADPGNAAKNLVRFHYHDHQDVFDAVTYQKGGRILNMLRNYLGAPAFFKGLNIYLTNNAFKNGEAQQLRLALEEASGKDLNWFFNQWYYRAGHPVLDISYRWDEAAKTQLVMMKQNQEGEAFILPVAVDIYHGDKKERRQVRMEGKTDTLRFKLASKPDLVNVDADKILLSQKTDHKALKDLLFQYKHAPLYMDRLEAIEAAAAAPADPLSGQILSSALKDKYYGLRLLTLQRADLSNAALQGMLMPQILELAKNDDNNQVRAAAISILGADKNAAAHEALFREGLKSQSYAISGASLQAISILHPDAALETARSFMSDNKAELTLAMVSVFAKSGSDAEWPFVYGQYKDADPQSQAYMMQGVINMTAGMQQPEHAQQGIQLIRDFAIKYKSRGFGEQLSTVLGQIREVRSQMKDAASAAAAAAAMQKISEAK